jgi:hypothetical protein
MGGVLAQSVPLAFAAAISPLVLMGILAILGGPNPKRHAIAFTLGVVSMIVGLLVVGMLLIGAQNGKTDPGPLGSNTAHLVVGIVLILVSALMIKPSHKDPQQHAEHKHRQLIKANAPLIAFFGLGIALMCTNFSTIVVLLAILHGVARANQGLAANVVALAVVAFITALPATGPLAAALFGGPRLAADVQRPGTWTTKNGKYILAVLFLVFGLQDILQSLSH